MWVVDGLSSGQIARALHTTRGSVLGKLHRLGLTGTRSQNKSNIEGDGRSRTRQAKINASKPTEGDGIKSIAVIASDPPASERVSWDDLKPHHCRWPFEDGTYCGCQRESVNVSYCSAHLQRAYYPAKKHGRRMEDYFARIDQPRGKSWFAGKAALSVVRAGR